MEKKLKETFLKLVECDKARKNVEASIESTERQAQEQLLQLRDAESQLAIAQTTIFELKKELSQKDEEMNKVEQITYDQGQKETKAHLKSQLPVVCHSFCLQTRIEPFNAVGVDPASELRNPKRAFYPPAIKARLATQPPVSTSSPAPTSSTKNPPPKSSAIVVAQPKPTEKQQSTTVPTKAKQTKPLVSKPSATTPQSTMVVAKVPQTKESSSTVVLTTKVARPAPTPTTEAQPVTRTGKQKTPKAQGI